MAKTKDIGELKLGDAIGVVGYDAAPLYVARVGETHIRARVDNLPWLVTIAKKDIVWKEEQPLEQRMQNLKNLNEWEPTLVLMRKKKKLKEVV